MDRFSFTKMHGLGNSYIYVNMFEETIPESLLSELAVKVSNVHTGIGADGMILICPSEVAPVKMRIFNSDGSEGKNCGNGLRCVAKYAYEHQLVNERSFFIETLSGLVKAEVFVEDGIVTKVTVDMGKPRLKRSEIPMLGEEAAQVVAEKIEVAGETYEITAVSMGNPHVIFYVNDINQAPVTTLGPIVEKDPRFPEGVNVEFVEVVNDCELHFRVWERGSGVTQACGTGACAAVVASVLNGKTARNQETVVHLAGGDLSITWTDEGNVFMTGPAETICTGVYYI
ncbi:diaminopimelate epimerase [Thermaerobacillus caldiproteolyticus]|uniref:Diaminopimelate epimerase n=1 Tax=Thermaerobacillus caldiproteolyticus TaxID=247480 RepID=A0A7V9Z7Z4_9BACL|nr:diaminopimelate epimerase [Anoxybacillus caldiproteolyticus]MBA2875625.1 diaminopimelate epimerase [Anoxybacillus caldiproteolyticus]QPA30540.1 diaminopimelate epimerase [Anoxybacillus caldiproteolyticus]